MHRKVIFFYLAFSIFGNANNLLWATDPNLPTAEEKAQGFFSLFNGRNLHGWAHNGNWKVEDGVIVCVDPEEKTAWRDANDGTSFRQLASLVCNTQVPNNFEIVFEWKSTEDNRYRSLSIKGKPEVRMYRNGCGILRYDPVRTQNLVVHNHEEEKIWARIAYLHCTSTGMFGLLSDEVPGVNAGKYIETKVLVNASKPKEQWNKSRIVGKGAIIQYWLNDTKTFEGEIKTMLNTAVIDGDAANTENERTEVQKSFNQCWKQKDKLHFVIKMQNTDKGKDYHPVYYRGIKLRSLEK